MATKYWEIFVDEFLPEIIPVPTDKRDEVLSAIAHHAEMESEACGYHFIPDPRETELKEVRRQAKIAEEAAEDDRRFWQESYLRARGFSPDSFYVRREGRTLTIMERR